MKTFRDTDGSAWTVFEVRRVISARRGTPVPLDGQSNGWLCFENGGYKRRLLRFPERWREFSDGELQGLLSQARPAPRTTWRLGELDDLTPPADARSA